MEDKTDTLAHISNQLDIVISLLAQMIPDPTTTNKTDAAAFAIAGDVNIGTPEKSLYGSYLTAHKKMNIETPVISTRAFNKVVKLINDDLVLKNTTIGGEQIRVWKEK